VSLQLLGLFELYLVAVAISLDSFTASLALGTRVQKRGWLRVAAVFAVSGGSLPVVGMWLGALASGALVRVAGGIGALVLAGLGGWFLHGALRPGEGDGVRTGGLDRIDGKVPLGGLVLLALGLSSDNLLVGLGLGLRGETNWLLGALTTFSVFGATLTGLWLGRTKRKYFGRVAEGLAGLLLLGLATWMLVEWMQGSGAGSGAGV
jgi:manganese efflux pump family protein